MKEKRSMQKFIKWKQWDNIIPPVNYGVCKVNVKGENTMEKLIKWCEENGFQLLINPNDFRGNGITFVFIHYGKSVLPDFRMAHSIDKIELYESRVSEDVLCMNLIEHIENEWANYKKAEGM